MAAQRGAGGGRGGSGTFALANNNRNKNNKNKNNGGPRRLLASAVDAALLGPLWRRGWGAAHSAAAAAGRLWSALNRYLDDREWSRACACFDDGR